MHLPATGFLMTSFYFWPQNHFSNAQGIATKLTDCFRQAVDFLIIRVSLIPDKSIGQVRRGRKPLLEQSPNHGDHQMDLHEVKGYDGLGHGDLKNWLVPRGSGTQVGKLQIRSRNCGFFMQDLGLKKKKSTCFLLGSCIPKLRRYSEQNAEEHGNKTQQNHYSQITSELLSIDYKYFCRQPNALLQKACCHLSWANHTLGAAVGMAVTRSSLTHPLRQSLRGRSWHLYSG